MALTSVRWCTESTDPIYYALAAVCIAAATVVAYSCVLLAASWLFGVAIAHSRLKKRAFA